MDFFGFGGKPTPFAILLGGCFVRGTKTAQAAANGRNAVYLAYSSTSGNIGVLRRESGRAAEADAAFAEAGGADASDAPADAEGHARGRADDGHVGEPPRE